MRKIKTSVIFLLIAGILCGTVCSMASNNIKSDVFEGDTSYMTVENLALSSDNDKFKKLTDGKNNTSFNFYAKSNTEITIDLKATKTFNSIVLKEDGLNIKDFSILISTDGKSFEQIYKGDKIEYHRLCTFDTVEAKYVRLFVNKSDRFAKLKEIEIYNQEKVDTSNFRNTGYMVDSEFSEILANTNLLEAEKKDKILDILKKYSLSSLTDLNFYCGVGFNEKGEILLNNEVQDTKRTNQNLATIMSCLREMGRANLKISYVIGISTGSPVANPAMDGNKDILASNMIEFANQYGFNGIDIDYEFPQSDYDYKVFGDYLITLKNKMNTEMTNGKNSLLSCAFGTRDINYPKEVIDAIDVVNMMTYDIFDQDGQHSSFWSCAVQGAKYLESIGFSKEQINIGIPFYGTQTNALMEQYIYRNATGLDSFSNMYVFPSYYDGSPTEVYFNSPAIVRDKTAYALLSQYGGVMVWSFFCDVEYSNEFSLWRAIDTAINQFGKEE